MIVWLHRGHHLPHYHHQDLSIYRLAGIFPPGAREATRVSHQAVQSGVGIGSSSRHLGLGLLSLGLGNLGLLGSHQFRFVLLQCLQFCSRSCSRRVARRSEMNIIYILRSD